MMRNLDWMQLQKPLSTLRLLHYPPRDKDIPALAKEDDVVIQCAACSDTTFTTILATFENRGLEIYWTAMESGSKLNQGHTL